MNNKIEFEINRTVKVNNLPFSIAIYVNKNEDTILVEDFKSGKSILTTPYNINHYIRINDQNISWKESFNKTYTKFDNGRLQHFIPLYEQNRFATLTFKINKNSEPPYKFEPANNQNSGYLMIDNKIPDNISLEERQNYIIQTYNYQYKNIKEFETEKFKLDLIDNETEIVDEEFNIIKTPIITCTLPLFQLYTIVEPIKLNYDKKVNSYKCDRLFMKIGNYFYRFPYGNVSNDDRPCLGSTYVSDKKIEHIQDVIYSHIVTSEFNGDYVPQIKFNKLAQTTFDIDLLKEKINHDDFNISFIDALFYISQCKTLDEINKNIFIFTVNVPKEIIEFEKEDIVENDSSFDQIRQVEENDRIATRVVQINPEN